MAEQTIFWHSKTLLWIVMHGGAGIWHKNIDGQCMAMQVYGPESSGKTTLALHAMAAVQRAGGTALLVDAEHAFDAQYSKVTCQSFFRLSVVVSAV